jgi:DNA-binding transcriptional LysR family regulator
MLTTVAELGSNEGIREAVKAGMGVSILSRLAVRSDLEAGLLKEILLEGVNLGRDIYTVGHKARYTTPICKRFKEFLKKWS